MEYVPCAALAAWALAMEREQHFRKGKGGSGVSFDEFPETYAQWKSRDSSRYRHVLVSVVLAMAVFVLGAGEMPSGKKLLCGAGVAFVIMERVAAYYAYHVDYYAQKHYKCSRPK